VSDQIAEPPPLDPSASLTDVVSWAQAAALWMREREPVSVGSALSKFVPYESLVGMGVLTYSPGTPGGGGDVFVPGFPLDPGTDYLSDLTPPPDATGLTGVSLFSGAFLQWDAPTYLQGGGNAYTEIYAANYSGTGPLPTFGSAVWVGTASGAADIYVDAAQLGVERHYWIKFVSRASVRQVNPTGGLNGVTVTIGLVGNANLGPLIVSAEKLSQGTYAGVNMVPNPGAEDGAVAWVSNEGSGGGAAFSVDTAQKYGGSQAFKLTKAATGDGGNAISLGIPVIPGETYGLRVRYLGSSATGSGLFLRCNEMATKPAGGYVTAALRTSYTQIVADNSPIPATWTTATLQYQVPAGVYWISLAVYNWVNGPLSMWFDDLSMGRQITAEYLAANSIAVGSLAVQNGAIVNAMIANLAVDNAKVANLDALKISIGSGVVGGDLRSSNYVAGSAGWIIRPSGAAQFEAANIIGLLTTGQIQVGAVTARAQTSIGFQSVSWTNSAGSFDPVPASDHSVSTTFTSSGGFVLTNVTGTIDVIAASGVASIGVSLKLARLNGADVVQDSQTILVLMQVTNDTSGGTRLMMPYHMTLMDQPSAASWRFSIVATGLFAYDSSGTNIAPGAGALFQIDAHFVHNEFKV
jgi:hypothetical protein